MSIESGERLTKHLEHSAENCQRSSVFDLADETETLFGSIGASPSASGGESSFYGRAPLVRSVRRFRAAAAALADKALQSALTWRLGAGECQEIYVDVRRALRRIAPSVEGRWELLLQLESTAVTTRKALDYFPVGAVVRKQV